MFSSLASRARDRAPIKSRVDLETWQDWIDEHKLDDYINHFRWANIANLANDDSLKNEFALITDQITELEADGGHRQERIDRAEEVLNRVSVNAKALLIFHLLTAAGTYARYLDQSDRLRHDILALFYSAVKTSSRSAAAKQAKRALRAARDNLEDDDAVDLGMDNQKAIIDEAARMAAEDVDVREAIERLDELLGYA